MAVHVRYKSLYISLPSSSKQQREITKFCVGASDHVGILIYRTWPILMPPTTGFNP